MADVRPAHEFARIAQGMFALAADHCGDCRDYHAVRPYLRAAGMVLGLQRHESQVAPWLRKVAGQGARVLIAGAGDSGVFLLASRVLGTADAAFTVIDRCETPLALCREDARRQGLTVITRAQDLSCLQDEAAFDVVLVHRLSAFLSSAVRLVALARLRAALRPEGRLVLVIETVDGPTDEHQLQGIEDRTAEKVMSALQTRGIPLPEPAEDFAGRLRRYGRASGERLAHLRPYDAIVSELAQAGLAVEVREALTPRVHALGGIPFRDELLIARRAS